MTWSFQGVWNSSLETRDERPLSKRWRIWASELGGSMIDRYLKMNAVAYTNPPNPRSLRKFEAGNLMEWVAGVVLKRAGVLIDNQQWNKYEYDGLFPVTGKLDFLAGGNPDWERAEASLMELSSLGLPDIFSKLGMNLVDHFKKTYSKELKKIVIEIKSCSAYMYDYYENTGSPNDNHTLQAFHYLKSLNMDEAHIVYISKDDLRILEFGLFNPSPIEEIYKKDIETISKAVKYNKQPEKEQEIEFRAETGRFYDNWKVKYSNYLTMLYGYKDQKEYEDKYKPLTAKFNRVFKRCVLGQNMTKLNLEVIEEAKKVVPHWDELVDQTRSSGVLEKQTEEEGEES